MTRKVSLQVNDVSISVDYFVESFIDHTVAGVMAAMEGTGEIETLELVIDGDTVSVTLNGAVVPLNAFAQKIIKATITGMIGPLKGVADNISTVKINIGR